MIIMIILISLFVLCLIIAGFIMFNENDIEAAATISGLPLLPLVICSIICIFANSPTNVETKKYALQERVALFENRKAIIDSYHPIVDETKTEFTSDITLETISTSSYYKLVEEYNKEVFLFKTDIVKHQIHRDNPWTSWFWSPAYSSITEETLSSIIYTTGK